PNSMTVPDRDCLRVKNDILLQEGIAPIFFLLPSYQSMELEAYPLLNQKIDKASFYFIRKMLFFINFHIKGKEMISFFCIYFNPQAADCMENECVRKGGYNETVSRKYIG